MKARSVLAVAACVVGATLGVVVPASAGLTTFCEGDAGAVTVPGDLRVAAGKSCVLDGTIVTGTVTVEPDANLVITGGAFQRAVSVQDNGFLDAQGTTFGSTLTVTDGYGVFMGSTTSGSVKVSPDKHPERPTYTYLNRVTVNGDYASTVGAVYADSSTFSGSFSGANVAYVDLLNSVVNKDFSVSGAPQGSVFCANEVYGNSSYSGNPGTLQIGADGPIAGCGQASFFFGNLDVSGNTGGVTLGNTIIRGNLAGTGNDPAPTGSNNRVRGTTSGQFVNLAPQAAARGMAAQQQNPADKLGERKAQAVAAAQAAGPAAL
ncbi:hypothetical protein [Actinocrispum wychmicini]|uniref:Uncharacterized protein n=1 Tax=Actinocrispum wychmicini TaxID=1213861 RepID=A0A4R2ILC7_9PSEU|nr:hypothetical protein [Actinocrispum wychmicini]TCO44698.1 hypothetical protein EV192_12319 [Actinocrispum wychmicini]